MMSRLTNLLPPDHKDFEQIAKAYISEDSETIIQILSEKGYGDLLKTLAIYKERLAERTWWWTFRRISQEAYRHYLANTDGEIPQTDKEEKHAFNIEHWVKIYAEDLGIKVKRVEANISEENEVQRAYLDISFGERVNRIETAQLLEHESSASAFRRLALTINKLRYGKALATPAHIFKFETQKSDYSHQNAAWLAEFSLLSYFHIDFLKLQLKQWKYSNFKWIENLETDTQCLITEKDDHTVLCFRGTSSFKDTLIDLKIKKVAEGDGDSKVRIHRGFNKALEMVWEALTEQLGKRKSQSPIFICGHSLGGALAKLAAYKLSKMDFHIGGVYTFGAPRVGNKYFAEEYEKKLGQLTYLVVNYKDIVPQIPPKVLGFRHVGAEIKHFGHDHQLIEEVQTRSLGSRSIEAPEERELTPYELGQMRRQLAQALETDARMRDYFHGNTTEIQPNQASRGMVDDHSMFEYISKVGINALEGKKEKNLSTSTSGN